MEPTPPPPPEAPDALPRPELLAFVPDATPRERREVEAELWEAELIRWATRPQPLIWCAGTWTRLIVATLGLSFIVFWCGKAMQQAERVLLPIEPPLLSALISTAPLWLTLLFLATQPWRKRLKARRTLYLITDRRAIVMKPRLFSPSQARSWKLARNMVVRGEAHPDKRGNLVLTEHIIGNGGSPEYTRQVWRYGFLDLTNVWEAEKELRKAIEARRRTPSRKASPHRRKRR